MKIVVRGVGITAFGELWADDVGSLAQKAVADALLDAQLAVEAIDALVVGNMLLPYVGNQSHVGAYVASTIGFSGLSLGVEGACASGGLAMRQGLSLLASGMAKRVLVVGVEKMTDASPSQVTSYLMGASSEEERLSGATFPGLYAMMHRMYQQKYGCTDEAIASVAVKNHYHASLNSKAHFQSGVTRAQVLASPLVADPIRLLHCSSVSDGATAVVLESVATPRVGSVVVLGSGQGGDNLSLAERESITTMRATRRAVAMALHQANVSIEAISVAELHDCFSIAEVIALEDLGLVPVGEGAKKLEAGFGRLDSGGVAINTSGGLKACGHPIGATGVKQVVEITEQLRGNAGDRQVAKADFGLTHNVGGTGATAVVHILGRQT